MKFAYFIIFVIVLSACTRQKDAFVFIESKTEGRTQEGFYYLDVKVKNSGEQPAYFVILISQAYKGGKDLQRIEKGYGDIFPKATKEMRIVFDRIGIVEPDSVSMQITYSPYQL